MSPQLAPKPAAPSDVPMVHTPLAVPKKPLPWVLRFGLRIVESVPALLIFAGLMGLLYWGNKTDWTLPKFSELYEEPEAPKEEWCGEHNNPKAKCIECNKDLLPRPKSFGWCKEHGVHDCVTTHPELAQLDAIPPVNTEDLARFKRALALMKRPENEKRSKLHERRIQFESIESAERAGIEVDPVSRAPITEAITGSGELAYEPTRVTRLSSRVPGTVYRVEKQLGDPVEVGEPVVFVDSPEIGRAKSEFLVAYFQVRLKTKILGTLNQSGVSAAKAIFDAEMQISEAKIKLAASEQVLANLGLTIHVSDLQNIPDDKLSETIRMFGLPEMVRSKLPSQALTGNLIAITAPHAGRIVTRDVVAGEVIDSNKILAVVADPRVMILNVELRLEETQNLAMGQTIRFKPDGYEEEIESKIDWISTEADPRTRTVKARATIPNPTFKWKANTYGRGRVILRHEENAIVVPNEAVHTTLDGSFVFVRDKSFLTGDFKVFYARSVRIGAVDEHHTEILSGLLPNELVVTKGSGGLRAELLRGSMGEGEGGP